MEFIVSRPGGLSYTATSLADIAQQLDRMASAARAQTAQHATQKMRRYKEGEAAAYAHVADMLRHTTLQPAEVVRG